MKIKSTLLNRAAKNLLVEADIDFDQFDHFAEPLVKAIDGRVLNKQWGADRHQWTVDFEGTELQLNYEFYTDSCWLSVNRDGDLAVLSYLDSLLKCQIKVSVYG